MLLYRLELIGPRQAVLNLLLSYYFWWVAELSSA